MKLANPYIYKPFYFDDNSINVLVIENSNLLYKYVNELLSQKSNMEGNWVLSDNDREIKFSKGVDIITYLFNINLKNANIIKNICLLLRVISQESKYYIKTMELKQNILEFTQDLLNETDLPFETGLDFDMSTMFKYIGIQPIIISNDFVNNCCNYLQCMRELSKIQLFIFVNLKTMLNENDLCLFYKEVCYRKLNILLLENSIGTKNELETVRLIDKDMCEIY